MSTEVAKFENKYMQAMVHIAIMEKQSKEMADKVKVAKEELEAAMNEYNIKSIDNEFLKITRVEASSSTSIDLKKLLEKEPKLHGELLEDYPKVTNRKAHVKFTVK
ncbi:hypothetical protein ACQCVB_20100 [Fictibacillus phosphorivorans]|uniref:hypothetical protein n=1 Tax=Fictibacillus phosphorivorans TaxID=1221500 RepID=UPI003CF852E6